MTNNQVHTAKSIAIQPAPLLLSPKPCAQQSPAQYKTCLLVAANAKQEALASFVLMHALICKFIMGCMLESASSVVQVMRWSDGSYLEDQDHWWLSGIHRDVFLLAKPLTFIADYHVRTPLTFAAKGSNRLSSAR